MSTSKSSLISDHTTVATLGNEINIQQVLLQNSKYLFENVIPENLSNGFIKVQYSSKQLNTIIEAGEIAVIKTDDCIMGYYLIGCNSGTEFLTYQKLAADRFAENKSTSAQKIGYGVQVCIDELYQNKGLFTILLDQLVRSVANKYDYLLCSVSDNNEKSLKIHLKAGWEIFEQSEGKNVLFYKITTLGL